MTFRLCMIEPGHNNYYLYSTKKQRPVNRVRSNDPGEQLFHGSDLSFSFLVVVILFKKASSNDMTNSFTAMYSVNKSDKLTASLHNITTQTTERNNPKFSSRWYLCARKKTNIRAPPRLSEVSPTLPLKQLQCSSDWRWPSLVLSRKIVFALRLSTPPDDRWYDVIGFVPAGSVSSFSTLQIFLDASLYNEYTMHT